LVAFVVEEPWRMIWEESEM
jgi:hypothetical protein